MVSKTSIKLTLAQSYTFFGFRHLDNILTDLERLKDNKIKVKPSNKEALSGISLTN